MASTDHTSENPKARLLIVDDEAHIRRPLVRALGLEGYHVEGVASATKALARLRQKSYDLMLVDLRMPGMDGVTLMKRARQICPDLLIIVLTGHASLESAIAAIKTQATDYLLKPASTREIVETVAGVLQAHQQTLRRQRLLRLIGQVVDEFREQDIVMEKPPVVVNHSDDPAPSRASVLIVPPLLLDQRRRVLMLAGVASEPITLTDGELSVLSCLMSRPNRVFTCSQIARAAWGYEVNEKQAKNMVRPHISRLRQKFGSLGADPHLLRTVRGRGYVLASVFEGKI